MSTASRNAGVPPAFRSYSTLPQVLALLLILITPALCQNLKAQEREYPFPLAAVQAALQNVGGYGGNRLPSLEGFIKLEGVRIEQFQRPYYEYRIDLESPAPNRTLVRVKANVSAWYAAADETNSGYQALESNGRLESDLLDALSEYLKDKSADPSSLATRIAEVRQQRLDAEHRVAELQQQLRNLQAAKADLPPAEFVSVKRPATPILAAPAARASVVLRAQPEDDFEVLERRALWLRVALEESHSGWVKQSQVQASRAATTPEARPAVGASGFTIIREVPSDFSGDWSRLKGKKALYIWARPQGSSLNLSGDKLQFAQSVFMERYRHVAQDAQNPWAGIVVIFLDQKGGVAAASLDDIRLWASGSLTRQAFFKRCSMDPASAFTLPKRD